MKKGIVLIALLFLAFNTKAQTIASVPTVNTDKMKIEIWSDVMCPFCYIGKRKFESALSQFPNASEIEIEWKSFQLQPDMVTAPGKNVIEHLAETKGWTIEHSREMHDYVVNMAKEVGLDYHFEKAVVANSFNAHRLSHYAKWQGKGLEMEERLFQAYFINGENIDDKATLLKIATEIGLDEKGSADVINSDQYTPEVHHDIYEAQQVGVRGVPFFVLDEKYGVSGAQSPEVFLQAITQAHTEWKTKQAAQAPVMIDGKVCTPEGKCE